MLAHILCYFTQQKGEIWNYPQLSRSNDFIQDADDLCDLDWRQEKVQDDSVFQLEALFNTNMTTSHGLSSSRPIAFFYSCILFFKHILKHIQIKHNAHSKCFC